MALAELLLLLQVGITGAWKEPETLGGGREMEGRHESAAAREGKTCSSRACLYGGLEKRLPQKAAQPHLF
jgi:hypothetical protein